MKLLAHLSTVACLLLVTACAGPGPTPSPTPQVDQLQRAFETARAAVVRVETAGCSFYGSGTGFLVGDGDVIATAAHVVERSRDLRVIAGLRSVSAKVVGFDARHDVALLRVGERLGEGLAWAGRPAAIGDRLGAVGFTGGQSVSLKPGIVNGLDRKFSTDTGVVTGLTEFDSIADRGNSGGPVISPDGEVAGILVAGSGDARYLVPASTASALVAGWMANRPLPVAVDTCLPLLTQDGSEIPDVDPRVGAAGHTLAVYFEGIATGDYDTALAQFAAPRDRDTFRAEVDSTQHFDWNLRRASLVAGSPVIWYQFRSRQDAGRGPSARPAETCTRWSLDYTFKEVEGLWLIDRVRAHDPEAGASIDCDDTWPAERPVEGASEAVADVGKLPGNVPPTGESTPGRWAAVTFCQPTDRWFPGFGQRRASRFTESVSESGDSGDATGLLVMTTPGAADELMDELRASATACTKGTQDRRFALLTPPTGFDDAFAVVSEDVTASGTNGRAPFGDVEVVARRGRAIVAVRYWIYFMTPITGGDSLGEVPSVVDEVRELLDTLPTA